jgi:hypothetical protein
VADELWSASSDARWVGARALAGGWREHLRPTGRWRDLAAPVRPSLRGDRGVPTHLLADVLGALAPRPPGASCIHSAVVDEEDAIALMRRWWDEVWGKGDLDLLDELLTEPVVRHTGAGTEVTTRDVYRRRLRQFQRTMHRPNTTIDDITVSGDRVWARATSRGLNLETGERSVLTWMIEFRVVGDRIGEFWVLAAPGVDWNS